MRIASSSDIKFDVKGDDYTFMMVNSEGDKETFEWKKMGTKLDKRGLKKSLRMDHSSAAYDNRKYIERIIYGKKSAPTVAPLVLKIGKPGKVDYHLPDESKMVMSAVKRGKNILIVGPAGCGKSRMIIELAKEHKAKLERINLNGGTTDASLVGEKGLKTDEKGNTVTYFQYGILPRAMKEGAWLLLDELDFCQPEYLAVLQAVFEGNGTPLTILDNEGEKIVPHKDFRIIATANTLGRGDTNGYHGTNMLNIATLDRWSVITLSYTKNEPKILKAILGDENLVERMMGLAKRVRESINQGQLPDLVFSTRRLIHWAEALTDKDLSFEDSIELEIMGRLTRDERNIIGEFVKDIFAVSVVKK